jgi:ATP-dependent Clp protease ATP-binding subunit ClpB
VLLKPLRLDEIERIVDLLMADLRRRLAERKIELELTPAGRSLIAREGFDPVYGARPLRRFIQRDVETRLARALIGGEAPEGARVRVDAAGDALSVEIDKAAA